MNSTTSNVASAMAATTTEQTLVAVYDTAPHAAAAVKALQAANVPQGAITQHAQNGGAGGTTQAAPAREPGFWASLFGGASDDEAVYDRSVQNGATVVTVKVPEQHVARVSQMLEAHDPIDFDERAAQYGMTQGTDETTTSTATAIPAMGATPKAATAAMPVAAGTDGDTIKVVEERLSVGKRVVNRGGVRVRAYVVEAPVEEQVSLHSETVRIERRPVADGRVVTDADFADRTIEMTETREEAVVAKSARVVEEIGIRKEASDHVETVRDTVRRDEVEVEQIPAAAQAATTTGSMTATKTVTAETSKGKTAAAYPAARSAPPATRH